MYLRVAVLELLNNLTSLLSKLFDYSRLDFVVKVNQNFEELESLNLKRDKNLFGIIARIMLNIND